MPHAAVGAHRFGTFGFGGHSKNPRPPHPGQGTIFSWGDLFFMACVPSRPAPPDGPVVTRTRRTTDCR
jgi:hypothetical protein